MSKRFSSFTSTNPSKKRNSSTFVPWNQIDVVPAKMKNGDITAGILYLLNLTEVGNQASPNFKIVFKHQLYSLVENRTIVDRGVNALLEKGDIKLFKTSLGNEQLSIMFTKDYAEYVKKAYSTQDTSRSSASDTSELAKKMVFRFIDNVLPTLKDISVNEECLLKHHGFKDNEITELIRAGILTVKNAGTWWLSIPNVGFFMKLLRKGRQTIIQTINRTKYKEISRDTLLTKKSLPSMRLNIEYQIHDLIGADLVKCIHSTTGVLLRLIVS